MNQSVNESSASLNHNVISNKSRTGFFGLLVISNKKTFQSQILRALGPMGESSMF